MCLESVGGSIQLCHLTNSKYNISYFPVSDRVSLYSVACCVRYVANALCEVGSYRLVPPHKAGPGAVRGADGGPGTHPGTRGSRPREERLLLEREVRSYRCA